MLLSGVDAVVFLVAVVLNLESLLRFDGIVWTLLISSGAALVAAAAAGFAGGVLLGRPSPSRSAVAVSGVLNGVLMAGVAAYYATVVRPFGTLGVVFAFLAFPGFVGAWIAWRSLTPS